MLYDLELIRQETVNIGFYEWNSNRNLDDILRHVRTIVK
jgi:hypothetical protein